MAKRRIPYQSFEPEASIFRKLQIKRARSYHFLIDADEAALANLCDRWFNQLENQSVRFRPAAPVVMITVINSSCATGNCEQETWETGGCPFLPEHCSRVLLLDDFDEVQGAVKCNQCFVTVFVQTDNDPALYGFTPYRFIDSGLLMIRNRELLGLPDVFASMKFPLIPAGQHAEENFSLSTRMKLKHSFDNPQNSLSGHLPAAQVMPVATEVLLIDSDPEEQSTLTAWNGPAEVMNGVYEFVGQFAAAPGREKLLQLPLFRQLEPFVMMNKWINLKQFRSDESDRIQPDKATYQSLLEYSYQPMQIRRGGRIDGSFTVRFPRIEKTFVDSLQFVVNLGVSEENPVRAAYWVDFDCELHFQNMIWEAT